MRASGSIRTAECPAPVVTTVFWATAPVENITAAADIKIIFFICVLFADYRKFRAQRNGLEVVSF